MKHYEMMVIIDSKLEEEEITRKKEELVNLLQQFGGNLEKIDDWGIKDFAYPIKKRDKGYYVIYYFEMEPGKTLELRKKIEMDEGVLRSMIIKRDKN